MAWITLPFPAFHLESGRQPAQQLDDDFAAIVNALNAFNPSGAAAGPSGGYGVRSLRGATLGAAQYQVSADLVMLRNATTGALMVQANVGPLTNDNSVAGPVPNGRDQVAVFAPSSWMHLYFIGNPTTNTVATISSGAPPSAGPHLPSGYELAAYAATLRIDGGSALVNTFTEGAQMFYRSHQVVVNTAATPHNTETSVDVSAAVPPQALSFLLDQSLVASNGATSALTLTTRVVSAQDYSTLRGVATATEIGAVQSQMTLPNISQQYLYLWVMGTPSAPVLDEAHGEVLGYRVANGDS